MPLFEQINNDIKKAMLAREKEKLEALRAIKSAFLLANSEKGASAELADADALKIIQKLVKQRKESADIYKEQNRPELYEKEMAEVKYLEAYLPEQMGEDEIRKALQAVIEEVGATSAADMGKVMGAATKKLAGKADNKIVSQLVREMLA
jgi:uncharacterized protein